jgi:branched-chain amino acid transport system substrate-binding protein
MRQLMAWCFFVCNFIAFVLLWPSLAQAQISGHRVKIGVLTDLAGPYEQNSGAGSVEAAMMAAEEFGNKINGAPIEIVSADHQNKPDVGASIARHWFDLDGVDAVTDLVNSGVAFAVLEIAKANNKAVLLTSPGSADFTGKACAPNNSVHWVYDTYQMGAAIGQSLPQLGNKWFFITADYVFGRALRTVLPLLSRRTAARFWAQSDTHSAPPTSPPSCCRRRLRVPT